MAGKPLYMGSVHNNFAIHLTEITEIDKVRVDQSSFFRGFSKI